MTQLNNLNPLQFQNPPTLKSPRRIAVLVGEYVLTLVVVLFWMTVATIAIGACVVAVRAVWFGVSMILHAVGV